MDQTYYEARREYDLSTSGVSDKRGPFEKVFHQKNKGVPLKMISDGLSNTVMLGEVRQYPGFDSRGVLYLGSCFYIHEYLPNTAAVDDLEWCADGENGKDDQLGLLNASAPCTEKHRTARGPWKQTARSQHPGGVNVAYCDGRVEFITDDVDIETWRAISTRSAGEIIQ